MENTEFLSFFERFKTECFAHQTQFGKGLELSFIQCAYDRTDESDIDELVSVYVEGKVGTNKIKVEGYRYDDDKTLVLAVAAFDFFKQSKTLTSSDALTIANRVRAFYKLIKEDKDSKIISTLNIDFSTPEYDMIDGIKNFEVERVQILFFTDYTLGDRFKSISIESVYDTPFEVQIWDLRRLYELELLNGKREPIEYSFEDRPIKLDLASSGVGFNSYIGVIPAVTLAKMYKSYGARLLEGNVRAFLTTVTKVNRNIRDSLKKFPEKFFILNNGIAVTAKKLKFNEKNELVGATDFQIINGGQTTASISRVAYIDKTDVSKAFVALKLTEITDQLSDEDAYLMVRNISLASNNQNRISDSDFSSNDPFHIEMEKKSEHLIAPSKNGLSGTFWYYERTKGAYKQKLMFKSKSDVKIFEIKYPKKQVIKKEDFARVRLCWSETPEPNIVSKGAAALFSVFTKYINELWASKDESGEFSDSYFKNTVSLIIMLRDLKEEVKKSSWYNGGYLANIATYSISVLAEHVRLEWGKINYFNLNIIWKEQSVPQDLMVVLLKIAKRVTDCITNPTQGNANITQWCKQQSCWNAVKKYFGEGCKILDEISEKYKLSKEELTKINKESKIEAKIDKGINLEIQIYQYKHWKDAYLFNKKNNIVFGKYQKVLEDLGVRAKYSEYSFKYALEALEKLRDEGFDF